MPARRRQAAKHDLPGATSHHAEQGGETAAENLLQQALSALARTEAMPGPGAPGSSRRTGLQGLRPRGHAATRPRGHGATGQKVLSTCGDDFEPNIHGDVVRLLADRQDIAALLRDAAPPV